MNCRAKTLLWIAGSLAVAVTTDAITQDSSPFDRIVVRNVFSLKSPAPPPDPELLKPAPPTIELQGTSTILGKLVLFKVKATRPGDKDESYILSEGQRKDGIEVKVIDEKSGSIQFDNHGTLQILTMAENSSKPSKSPVAGGIPRPVRGITMTTAVRGQQGLKKVPTTGNPRTSAVPASAGVVGTAKIKQSKQPQVTAEEQTVLIEVDRELNKDNIAAGQYPPLPPTELTPDDAVGIPSPVPQ